MQSPLLYVFLAASMLYLLVFIGLPIVYTLVMSVQDVTLANIADLIRPYVGLDNYRAALDDPSFRKVLVNSVIFVGVNVIGQVGIGLGAALFFAQRFPGAHFLRGLLLSSWICRRWWSVRCGDGSSRPNTAWPIICSPASA